jgi:hypothetical protein
METILTDFRRQRMELVARLDNLPPQTFALVAQHPRLNVPMRLVDMLFFQAEHDDYHLARISEMIRVFVDELVGSSKVWKNSEQCHLIRV